MQIYNERYPLAETDSPAYKSLLADTRSTLAASGLFNLPQLIEPSACADCVSTLQHRLNNDAFTHQREHNIFFSDSIAELPDTHAAHTKLLTTNHTLCQDQLGDTILSELYHCSEFINFLSRAMNIEELHVMDDPLAGINVMAYQEGEALNWHFDRSEFTTTLLLQAPEAGGVFEFRRGLKLWNNDKQQWEPDFDSIGQLVRHGDEQIEQQTLAAGTLNVFRGINTAHRVTPIEGRTSRIIAVFSYFDQPGVRFSDDERLGFYGRL